MKSAPLGILLLLAACSPDPKTDDSGSSAPPLTARDDDGDGLVAADDCDDSDPTVGGPEQFYGDRDRDGYGDATNPLDTLECDPPDGYVADDTDCDDIVASTNPGASEYCDGVDNDCDGDIDEDPVDILTWYADADTDTYGDPDTTTLACEQPDGGWVDNADDCDDDNASINPDGVELCNWRDDNCDGDIDEGLDTTTWYLDTDGDGFGVDDSTLDACGPEDTTWVADGGDCDDGDSAISPSAVELCDTVDNDCDGEIDEDDADDAPTWYADADGDSYGDPDSTARACAMPSGYVANSEDCDDTSADNSPLGIEVCDGADNDCDGDTDEDDAIDVVTWYADADADGWGLETDTVQACDAPSGYGAGAGDCDDTDDEIYPGAHEVCGDDTDSDCDGDDGSCGDVNLSSAAFAKLTGEATDDAAGTSAAWVGDIDGDGVDDILIGARLEDSGASDAGAAYLVTGAVSGTVSLSSNTAKILGAAADDYLGDNVSGAGDVDGDGYDDLLVGSRYNDDGGSSAGAAWLFLGPVSGDLPVSSADSMLTGEAAGDYAGAVAPLGDVDNDGFDDFIVGAYGEDSVASDAGAAYILLGPLSTDLDLSMANAKLYGEAADDRTGYQVSGAGDTDGDGYDDVLVGAIWEDSGGSNAGAVYLLNGPVRRSRYLSSADAKLTGVADGDKASRSVAAAGDVDDDGYDDVIVGAYQESTGGSDAGAAYLVSGPISGTVSLTTATAMFIGESPHDFLGTSTDGAGDLDSDGYDDLIMGAYQEDAAASGAGASYVIYGPASGSIDLFDTDAKLMGEAANDGAGAVVAGGGDHDGDRIPDLLIAAPYEDTAASGAGAVYLVLGGSF